MSIRTLSTSVSLTSIITFMVLEKLSACDQNIDDRLYCIQKRFSVKDSMCICMTYLKWISIPCTVWDSLMRKFSKLSPS